MSITNTMPKVYFKNSDDIPPLMRSLNQWIMWRTGEAKPDGKFAKCPQDARTGKTHDAFDSSIWLSFDAACTALESDQFSGIGFVLDGNPVTTTDDGDPLYLIGLDIDEKSGMLDVEQFPIKQTWLRLGKPYAEASPSGKGVRMFALSKEPLKNHNKNGLEIYTDKRYLTVTGNTLGGTLKDCTEVLKEVHAEWFGSEEPEPSNRSTIFQDLVQGAPPPETPEQIARVKSMLATIGADCDYEDWRNIVWAVAATGWACAEDIAHDWSMTCPEKFDKGGFQTLWRSFKPDGGISFGTLVHMAKEAGWKPPEAPQEERRFKLLKSSHLALLPPLQWVIKGVLPAQGIAAIYGPSGSGKSFLVLDMLAAVARGADWFGRRVIEAPVIYGALEGTAGIKQRVQAWEQKNGQTLPDNFRIMLNPLALGSENDIYALADEIILQGMGHGIVVIDTLNQAAPEANENASEDMGPLIRNAKLLQALINGLVVLVHHTGKDATRGLRGHSSLLAALDAAIEISRDKDVRQWQVAKSKDGLDGAACGFKLEPVSLGLDSDGDEITSCVVARSLVTIANTKSEPQGKNQKAALRIIHGLIKQSTERGQATASADTQCISEMHAVSTVAGVLLLEDPKRKTERAKEAIAALVCSGHLNSLEGWIWSPT